MTNNREITVNIKDSKGRLEVALPWIGLIITAVTQGWIIVTNLSVLELEEKVEETQQLNNYLNRIGEIIIKPNTVEEIDYRPTYSLKSLLKRTSKLRLPLITRIISILF
ncbi:hypothetical protein [Crocosphaera chwakensis]|uniref:Uncharacterized protein n=1 Tax=Crocosphaera chwakensis CCY0110 TaxID=391612 RepID=A3IXN8_9CHRO|nr:hypothetical protein [Crocosphaera chwakensis]EAZ88739.1 hypothetical protein CY0110_27839 [Crocosphaera chwakensis CCY0110]